jgi:hypothetical protein
MGSAQLCRACGLGPRPGARFCDRCGAPASADSDFAEYKQVTVMFADVVGSMRIASALGPERLRELMICTRREPPSTGWPPYPLSQGSCCTRSRYCGFGRW